ncbi:MAG TPA: ABC transporter ATP-binding protein [Thermomicrobiales bacterium]|jgi:peptide/nickel transport system ATP-binding protein
MTEPILELDDLTTIFGSIGPDGNGTVAADHVWLTLDEHPPRILNIVGESGSGKTTVARTLLGLSRPTRGQARYRGKNIYELSKDELRTYRTEVQAVFQDPYGIFNPYYRINRVFDMTIKKFKLASSAKEKQDLIEEALRAVNLRPPDVLGRYPHQLSGGERQRVMLARAYLLRPKVIIADEPISMLDVAVRATLMNIFLDFKERHGMSTIFITHDLSAAYYLGGDIMVMARGRVVEEGPVDAVMANPAHPYTQLLLQSIPSPDPDETWDRLGLARHEAPPGRLLSRDRCLFAERCPHVMDICWQSRPQSYPAGSQHAACYLYRPGAPVASIPVVKEAEATAVS